MMRVGSFCQANIKQFSSAQFYLVIQGRRGQPEQTHIGYSYTHSHTNTQRVHLSVQGTRVTAIRLQQHLQREQVNILTGHASCCWPMFSLALSLSLSVSSVLSLAPPLSSSLFCKST